MYTVYTYFKSAIKGRKNAKQQNNGNCVAIISIEVEGVEHLRSIIARLDKVEGVFSVERITQ